MSATVEWAEATAHVSLVDEDFTDAYGTGLTPGKLGLAFGEVVVEGTADELRDLAARIVDLLPEVLDPEVIVMQVVADPGEVIRIEYPHGYNVHHDVHEYRDGDFLLACPHPDCGGGTFYEVDVSERWNPMEFAEELQPDRQKRYPSTTEGTVTRVDLSAEPADGGPHPRAGLPMLTVSEGRDGDGYETDHYLCRSCIGRVTLPEWLETNWW